MLARPGRRLFHTLTRIVSAALLLAIVGSAKAQTWTHLVRNPPGAINLMLLLSDGTVMAFNNNGSTIGSAVYRLTPDSAGSYINGTWTTLASMHDTRLYYSSQVLMDGRVFIAGGEYGTGGARSEVYNPLTNVWTQTNPPTSLLDPAAASPINGSSQKFFDSNSEILPNGNVLISPVLPKVAGQPLIYNPNTNVWSAGPNYFRGVYQDEASWVKLTDNTILTVDPFGTNSERYNPVTNTWINDGVVPVALYDSFGFELGGAFLLPNGKAFYLGSTGHTALYTPSGTTAPGLWAAGPDIPGAHGTPDAPAAMMPNGKILCAVSPIPTSANHFPPPTTFYEYDSATNTFAATIAPVGASDPIPTYVANMLVLPDGNVLYSHMTTDLYVYHPVGAPVAAGKPVITGVTANGDGSFHLTGTGLNGISEGACYGDDAQMSTNYPIVRISHSNGLTYFARTYNWSSTGVRTGALVVTTEYKPPATMPAGSYTIVVVANGIASDPFNPVCTSPSISQHPGSTSPCTGASAQFSVSATGSSLSYQWRRGTTNLVNGGNISGATTAILSINPAGPADQASDYNCIVSNGCGSLTSSLASLTITAAPQFASGPSDLTVFAGAPASFSVNVSGAASLQWRKDSVAIPGATGTTYAIAATALADSGTYDCIATATCGSVPSSSAQLTVLCYANCDGSSVAPILNANDFQCFLNAFAAADPYANCDGSLTEPVLNANDFQCFLNQFAAGCP